jgi:hypothetical protein
MKRYGQLKMEIKNKILLKISWYIGLIAFIGGWTIFLTWSGGRYLGARDFEALEIIGFFWMVGFFWLSLIALILLLAYILINRKNLHLKMLFTGLLILINIPSILFIIPLQGDIENKVFVKLTNQSGLENIELKLHGNLKTWNLGKMNQGSSKVFNYDPPYWNNDARLYQQPDTLNLIVFHNTNIDTIGFPTLRMGECKQLILDEN